VKICLTNIIVVTEHKIYHTLRIAAAMCLIGHGAFGLITKEVWCNYLAVAGIGRNLAYQLMPIIGSVDILMGISLLVYPVRAVALWLVFWGLATATMRPLSGEPFAELLERAGNFGAPLALLILCPPGKGIATWFQRLQPPAAVTEVQSKQLKRCLQVIGATLLAGHGWLNLIGKKGLLIQYANLGFENTQQVALFAGLFEMVIAILLLIRPLRPLVLLFLVWKIGSELFYPQWVLFEWVERGGSYGTLLALWFLMGPQGRKDTSQLTYKDKSNGIFIIPIPRKTV